MPNTNSITQNYYLEYKLRNQKSEYFNIVYSKGGGNSLVVAVILSFSFLSTLTVDLIEMEGENYGKEKTLLDI